MTQFEQIYQSIAPHEDEKLYELFHENSKITPYDKKISIGEIQERMRSHIVSFDYSDYPTTILPEGEEEFSLSLSETLHQRQTNLKPYPVEISLLQLKNLLHYSYGISRDNTAAGFPHPFRMVPSAGALYPLEIYFHHNYVNGLDSGLYHYNPMKNSVSCLMRGDHTTKLKSAFVQPDLILNSSIVIFITSAFNKGFFKYGERVYRFALLEAGHVAQNLALTAYAMKLACVTIGGYFDKLVDDFIGIDGVNHSTIYVASINGFDNRESQ